MKYDPWNDDPEVVAALLEDAADQLERDGWTTGTYHDSGTGHSCTVGALNRVLFTDRSFVPDERLEGGLSAVQRDGDRVWTAALDALAGQIREEVHAVVVLPMAALSPGIEQHSGLREPEWWVTNWNDEVCTGAQAALDLLRETAKKVLTGEQ